MADLEKVRGEGERSYFTNNGAFICPYVHGTPEFNEFERGWIQSLKRDPTPVSATRSPPPWDYTQADPPPPPERYNGVRRSQGSLNSSEVGQDDLHTLNASSFSSASGVKVWQKVV